MRERHQQIHVELFAETVAGFKEEIGEDAFGSGTGLFCFSVDQFQQNDIFGLFEFGEEGRILRVDQSNHAREVHFFLPVEELVHVQMDTVELVPLLRVIVGHDHRQFPEREHDSFLLVTPADAPTLLLMYCESERNSEDMNPEEKTFTFGAKPISLLMLSRPNSSDWSTSLWQILTE